MIFTILGILQDFRRGSRRFSKMQNSDSEMVMEADSGARATQRMNSDQPNSQTNINFSNVSMGSFKIRVRGPPFSYQFDQFNYQSTLGVDSVCLLLILFILAGLSSVYC
ncbi:hypothetical protein OXYTRIMIC_734 [Oxytricha trifallax]|uniref:Uncharacterized protein n=1 Tax=Oxytricha trifallax TaxID=1172189 RepID=A0A073HZC0_9SPIT|nr:hypothetical protein OXYTRIMIC_734 [Oxytricha trifallax]